MSSPTWLTDVTIGQIIAWLGLTLAGAATARKVWPILSGLKDLVDDWRGELERPGVPERPGVMAQLADLRLIKHEVFPNSGGSLRDAVDTAVTKADESIAGVAALTEQVAQLAAALEAETNRSAQHREDSRRWTEDLRENLGDAVPGWPPTD